MVICLQETHFKDDFCAKLNRYQSFYTNRQSSHASGGVAIFIRANIYCSKVNFNSSLEAVAITIFLQDQKITICNIYLPNSQRLQLADLVELKSQLPKPFIILGDYNTHNPLCESKLTDPRGQIVGKFIDDINPNLLNKTQQTHFNASKGSESTVDLAVVSLSIAENFELIVADQLHDSDHFPLIINMLTNNQ